MVKLFTLVLPNEKGIYVIPPEHKEKQYKVKQNRLFIITEMDEKKEQVEITEGLA